MITGKERAVMARLTRIGREIVELVFKEQPKPAIGPCTDISYADAYCGDAYPREGCTAKVIVIDGRYQLTIFSPDGAFVESYAGVDTPRAIARMLEEWCAGFAPRLIDRLDHSKPPSAKPAAEHSALCGNQDSDPRTCWCANE